MSHTLNVEFDSWYLAYNLEKKVFHFGFANAGSKINTHQPVCEFFFTESEMASRIDSLKEIEGWYEANKIEEGFSSNLT